MVTELETHITKEQQVSIIKYRNNGANILVLRGSDRTVGTHPGKDSPLYGMKTMFVEGLTAEAQEDSIYGTVGGYFSIDNFQKAVYGWKQSTAFMWEDTKEEAFKQLDEGQEQGTAPVSTKIGLVVTIGYRDTGWYVSKLEYPNRHLTYANRSYRGAIGYMDANEKETFQKHLQQGLNVLIMHDPDVDEENFLQTVLDGIGNEETRYITIKSTVVRGIRLGDKDVSPNRKVTAYGTGSIDSDATWVNDCLVAGYGVIGTMVEPIGRLLGEHVEAENTGKEQVSPGLKWDVLVKVEKGTGDLDFKITRTLNTKRERETV